jgi:hypothetical protein
VLFFLAMLDTVYSAVEIFIYMLFLMYSMSDFLPLCVVYDLFFSGPFIFSDLILFFVSYSGW